jgi:mRNA-degrading endonuclease RelE of RelBE toxin-antitoxin system
MFSASAYWITVVETNPFGKRAKELLTEDERESLIERLALSPETGDIILGTGGVRKLTWPAASQGKRGQVRIIYYFHDLNMPVYLLDVCSKGEKIYFSASGKRLIAQLVDHLVKEYSEQWSRIVKLQRDGA